MRIYILKLVFMSSTYFHYYTTDLEMFHAIVQYALNALFWNTWVTVIEEDDDKIVVKANMKAKDFVNSDFVTDRIKFEWKLGGFENRTVLEKYGEIYKKCQSIVSEEGLTEENMFRMVIDELKKGMT